MLTPGNTMNRELLHGLQEVQFRWEFSQTSKTRLYFDGKHEISNIDEKEEGGNFLKPR